MYEAPNIDSMLPGGVTQADCERRRYHGQALIGTGLNTYERDWVDAFKAELRRGIAELLDEVKREKAKE
jgi:hypothetical protein